MTVFATILTPLLTASILLSHTKLEMYPILCQALYLVMLAICPTGGMLGPLPSLRQLLLPAAVTIHSGMPHKTILGVPSLIKVDLIHSLRPHALLIVSLPPLSPKASPRFTSLHP